MADHSPPTAVGVCGFGRCGSSMAMAMLVAGGVPTPPGTSEGGYELVGGIGRAWRIDLAGCCVKLLDPMPFGAVPPGYRWRFVWMDRDPRQQSRSHVKFVKAFVGDLAESDETAAARFAASYARDRPAALSILSRAGSVAVLDYGSVLRNPRRAARRLRAEVWGGLDVDAAAAAVHCRGPECAPDLAYETSGHYAEVTR